MKCECGGILKFSKNNKTLFCDICGTKEGLYSAVARNLEHMYIFEANNILEKWNEDIIPE